MKNIEMKRISLGWLLVTSNICLFVVGFSLFINKLGFFPLPLSNVLILSITIHVPRCTKKTQSPK